MADIFDSITDYASRNYYDKFMFDEDSDMKAEILALQDKYQKMDLSEEQRSVIDELIKINAELCDDCTQKVYQQGLKDCVSILKELGII